MAYATAQNLIDRYDNRLVGDLASVDGDRLTSEEILDDTRVATALDDASGEIDASVKVGGRYTPAQLAALTSTGQKHLIRLTCDIAFWLLIDRRLLAGITGDEYDVRYRIYRDHLKELRSGVAIFDVDAAKEAGVPSQSLPTSVELTNQQTIAARARGRFYPAYSLPNGR